MREITEYYLKDKIGPFEFERLITEILFCLDRDENFPNRRYPDIRKIGGNHDKGHDAVSIIWIYDKNFHKIIFAFSKRKDFENKIKEDIKKHKDDSSVSKFVFVSSQEMSNLKLPENIREFEEEYGFKFEFIDINDLVMWLDNTDWGRNIKRKFGIYDSRNKDIKECIEGIILELQFNFETIEEFLKGINESTFVNKEKGKKQLKIPAYDLHNNYLSTFHSNYSIEFIELHSITQNLIIIISSIQNALNLFKQTQKQKELEQFQKICQQSLSNINQGMTLFSNYYINHFEIYKNSVDNYSIIKAILFKPYYKCGTCNFYSESKDPGYVINKAVLNDDIFKELKIKMPSEPIPNMFFKENILELKIRQHQSIKEKMDFLFILKKQKCPNCSNIMEMQLNKKYIGKLSF